jgi:hypothetical protein
MNARTASGFFRRNNRKAARAARNKWIIDFHSALQANAHFFVKLFF